jgi:hypothetical protein
MYAAVVHRSEFDALLSALSDFEIAMGEHCAFQEAMLNEALALTDEVQENTPRFDHAFDDSFNAYVEGSPEFLDCMTTLQRLSMNFGKMVETEQSIVNSYRAFVDKFQISGELDWLKDENGRLKDTFKNSQQSLEDSEVLRNLYEQECGKVNKLNTRLNHLQTELLELQEIVDELTVERSRLESRLEEAGEGQECRKCKKYKDRFTAVQNKVAGQQEEISELKTNLALARQRDSFQ